MKKSDLQTDEESIADKLLELAFHLTVETEPFSLDDIGTLIRAIQLIRAKEWVEERQ